MFVDFYQNFSSDAMWSANELMQFYRNIKSTKIKKKSRTSTDRIMFSLLCKISIRRSGI